MTDSRLVAAVAIAWTAVVSALHMTLNVDWSALVNERLPESSRKLNVAYIPVT